MGLGMLFARMMCMKSGRSDKTPVSTAEGMRSRRNKFLTSVASGLPSVTYRP